MRDSRPEPPRFRIFRAQEAQLARAIPSSGERIPAVGLGTMTSFALAARVFDEHGRLREVLRSFTELGGRVVDSPPAYDDSERVVSALARDIGNRDEIFWASKVAIRASGGRDAGLLQVEQSLERLGHIDLNQIHDLFRWQVQLPLLQDLKRDGTIRYVGVTTSHTEQHQELEGILRSEELDFVQLDYAIDHRAVERSLLPIARDRGIGVLVNSPFRRGNLFRRVAGQTVPGWAADFGARTWAQFFLKWVLGNEGVTGVLASTSDPGHLRENMGAGVGRVPTADERSRMARLIDDLPVG